MKKQIFISIVLLFFVHFGYGQSDSIAIRFGNLITEQKIREDIFTLASDSMLGRNTGSEGQKKAQNFLINQFTEMGVSPGNNGSFIQEFKVGKVNFIPIDLKIDDKTIDQSNVFCLLESENKELKIKNAILAGYGINNENYNDYYDLDVKNKAVFVLNGEPLNRQGNSLINNKKKSKWAGNVNLKIDAAKQAGVKVLVIVVDSLHTVKNKYKKWFGYKPLKLLDNKKEEDIALVYIDKDNFLKSFGFNEKKLKNYIKKIEKTEQPNFIELKKSVFLKFNNTEQTLTSSNILGIVTGTDLSNQYIVISAHYDHLGTKGDEVYNGADDNGSGVTAVLEIANAFQKASENGYGPRRSILFLLVSGEEKGLLGSKYYTSHPVYPLDKTMVDLNIDMIGRRNEKHEESNHYVYLIGADKLSDELNEISEAVNADYTQLELDYTYNADDDPNRFYYRSDHYNFAKNNIPVIFYFNGTHKDYHKISDTADKIELDALRIRAQLVFYTAWTLANRTNRIKLNP